MTRAAFLVVCLTLCAAGALAASDGNEFLDLLRPPDTVTLETETGVVPLARNGNVWRAEGVEVRAERASGGLRVSLNAPSQPVKTLRLRWNGPAPANSRYLGDAWERGYGDLQWKPLDAAGVMPWYFLSTNGQRTHGYGVMTGPAAMCAWTLDTQGVELMADVRCGGQGVLLGARRLNVCTVVTRRGQSGETAFAAAQAFCRKMCPRPRLPRQPVYGFNDWYCDYGRNSAESVRYYAAWIARLAPKGPNRPFMVIDDGWQPGPGGGNGGEWDRGNERFGDMARMARDIRAAGARPGLWVHILAAQPNQPQEWRIAGRPRVLDPSRPEVRAFVTETIARFRRWGYDLIKHDYSTFDIAGAWGKWAGAAPDATWAFADRSRTTAEILLDHYRSIQDAAGGALVIGCNTVNHLAAGVHDLQRIGDDTSGQQWDRTRKMGVNSLAFRGPQHGTFFAADADCVGLTSADAIPWHWNRQWLDLLARSGTPLFVSFKRGALTAEQERDVARALAIAATPQPTGEPLDWLEQLRPRTWKLMGQTATYDWDTPAPKP